MQNSKTYDQRLQNAERIFRELGVSVVHPIYKGNFEVGDLEEDLSQDPGCFRIGSRATPVDAFPRKLEATVVKIEFYVFRDDTAVNYEIDLESGRISYQKDETGDAMKIMVSPEALLEIDKAVLEAAARHSLSFEHA